MLMTTFNEITKTQDISQNKTIKGRSRYSTPRKARLTDNVIFNRQSFEEYPNIRISDLSFKSEKVIRM